MTAPWDAAFAKVGNKKLAGLSSAVMNFVLQLGSRKGADAVKAELAKLDEAPAVPSVQAVGTSTESIRAAVEQIKQIVETREGLRGSGLDRVVTVRDLLAEGLIQVTLDGVRYGGAAPRIPAVEVPAIDGGGLPFFDVPPRPENLTATGGVKTVILTWEMTPYRNHAYVEVLRAAADNPSTAVAVGQASGYTANVFVDSSVSAGQTYYYWVRAVNAQGVVGPLNSQQGVSATTGHDVPLLLDTLTGQITQSQLYADLGARIDLIDAPAWVEGSVNARLQQEATARADADSALVSKVDTLSFAVAPMLPADFSAGTAFWTFSRSGDPATVPEATGNVVTGDATFGRCLEVNSFTAPDHNLMTKGVVPAVAGRTYRVRARFKVTAFDGSAQFNLICAGLNGSYSQVGVSTSPVVTVSAAGQVVEMEALFSDTASSGVTAWPATSAYLRFGLRLNTSETGLVFRVQSIRVEDVTDRQVLSAAIQSEASIRSSETGSLFAKYTVKIDANGYVSGFGLASTANDATPTSEFAVRADSFYVASPSGPAISPAMPFIVRTTPTTIGGVSVPAGVYLTDAFIQNGTITTAKIANLAVDSAKVADAAIGTAKIQDAAITSAKIQDAAITSAKIQDAAINTAKIQDAAITTAKIQDATITDAKIANLSASKITSGTINVGQYIQSSNFVSGSGGWRIDGDGVFEANSGVFRGALSAATGTFAGSLSAATGTFRGELQAATGTFSGTLTAQAVNAVDTINLRSQAVTIPLASYNAAEVTSIYGHKIILASVTHQRRGGNVFLFFSCSFSQLGYASRDGVITVAIERDGVVLSSIDGGFLKGQWDETRAAYAPQPNGIAMSVLESFGYGPATYVVTARGTMPFGCSQRSLLVLETLR